MRPGGRRARGKGTFANLTWGDTTMLGEWGLMVLIAVVVLAYLFFGGG